MAEAPSSLEFLLSCTICFEELTDSGDHVPRILPCTHTLCETCIKQLIRDNKLQCPECKAEHNVTNQTNEERSFPQNKYMLTVLKMAKKSQREQPGNICEKHGKIHLFFCKEPGCLEVICATCLTSDHIGHKVMEMEEKEKEDKDEVIEKLDYLNECMLKDKETLQNAIDVTVTKNEECLNNLSAFKEKFIQRFDAIIKHVKDQSEQNCNKIEETKKKIETNLSEIQNLRETVTVGTVSSTVVKETMEKIKEVENTVDNELVGTKTFIYFQYTKNAAEILENCGKVGRLHMDVTFVPKKQEEPTEPEQVKHQAAHQEPTPRIDQQNPHPLHGEHPLTPRGQVQHVARVAFEEIHCFCLVDESMAVVAGCKTERKFLRQKVQYKLKRINLQTGGELESVDLEFQPRAVTLVELGGKKTVAVAVFDGKYETIHFRGLAELKTVVHTREFATHVPRGLCVASPSTLFYVDASKCPREVHMLDCSGAEPKPVEGKSVIKTQLDNIWDMCVVGDGDRELLVCAGIWELEAYSMLTDQLVWRVWGRLKENKYLFQPCGVTTDGCGHLFVCDHKKNNCIQMFHVAGGRYFGALQVEGEQGKPVNTRWCEATSSLVVVYQRDDSIDLVSYSIMMF